jgi:pilus assembly protein CpaE
MPQSGPLRVLLICPDPGLRESLRDGFARLGGGVVLVHAEASYPSGAVLGRALRTFSPHAVFLSFEQVETAIAVVRFLEAEAEGLPVVGLHGVANPALLLQALRAGAREFLVPPFSPQQTGEVLQGLRSLLRKAPLSYAATQHIYSFLPAKPGAGTSTVALNIAAALAREGNMKVLLSDLDLTCGMIRFLLKLPQSTSIVDALARASEMDVTLWPQLVSHRDGIDVLHSGGVNPQAFFDAAQFQGLIDFARTSYNALAFDLSGNMERHSLQVMEESKLVFLVCNPEPGSLFQAREKLEFLRERGLADRVWVILNRSDQALAVPRDGVESFLGVPVAACFSDDTFWVNVSVAGATSVVGDVKGKNSKLAREFRNFARALVQNSRNSPESPSTLGAEQGMLAVA